MDHTAFKESKDLNPFDIPRTADGEVVTWCFGKYQHAKLKMSLAIPTASDSSKPVPCDKILLHEPSQVVLVVHQGSVFGYDLGTGACTMKFTDLHHAPITSVAYLPDQEVMITSSAEATAAVRAIAAAFVLPIWDLAR